MTPLSDAHFLADNLPQARLEIIPGAGHMVMLEKPLEVAQMLTEFWNICNAQQLLKHVSS
jgi:pimeloyl-ACP methyl ester carboxylesterase